MPVIGSEVVHEIAPTNTLRRFMDGEITNEEYIRQRDRQHDSPWEARLEWIIDEGRRFQGMPWRKDSVDFWGWNGRR